MTRTPNTTGLHPESRRQTNQAAQTLNLQARHISHIKVSDFRVPNCDHAARMSEAEFARRKVRIRGAVVVHGFEDFVQAFRVRTPSADDQGGDVFDVDGDENRRKGGVQGSESCRCHFSFRC